jgi:hypothetical protein
VVDAKEILGVFFGDKAAFGELKMPHGAGNKLLPEVFLERGNRARDRRHLQVEFSRCIREILCFAQAYKKPPGIKIVEFAHGFLPFPPSFYGSEHKTQRLCAKRKRALPSLLFPLHENE